jgi:hypothetical protein
MTSNDKKNTRWRTEVIEPKVLRPLDAAIEEVELAARRQPPMDDNPLTGALQKLKNLRQQFDEEPLCFRPADPDSPQKQR